MTHLGPDQTELMFTIGGYVFDIRWLVVLLLALAGAAFVTIGSEYFDALVDKIDGAKKVFGLSGFPLLGLPSATANKCGLSPDEYRKRVVKPTGYAILAIALVFALALRFVL